MSIKELGKNNGRLRESNSGPLAPEARIIPLDHVARAKHPQTPQFDTLKINNKYNSPHHTHLANAHTHKQPNHTFVSVTITHSSTSKHEATTNALE